MIVDVEITYAADFIPARGRTVRKGYASETIPFEIRSVATSDAPTALRFGSGNHVEDVRIHDDLLFYKCYGASSNGYSMETALQYAVQHRMGGTGLHHGPHRNRHPMPEGARMVENLKDTVLARLTAWADRELIAIDGLLHVRTSSSLIPAYKLASAYGKDLVSKLEEIGMEFVPAWFPPDIDGRPFLDVVDELSRSAPYEKKRSHISQTVATTLRHDIVDKKLLADAASDPRNLNWGMLGQEALGEFHKDNKWRLMQAMHPDSNEGWLESLLRAMAMGGGSENLPISEVMESMREVIRRPQGFDPKTASSVPFKNILETQEELSRTLSETAGHGNPDTTLAIDLDAWNLRVLATRFIAGMEQKFMLVGKKDLAAFARLVIHLKEWRTDPAAAFEPDADERLVTDATCIISLFEDPAFGDVGEEWERALLRQTIEAARARLDDVPVTAKDDELSNFRF